MWFVPFKAAAWQSGLKPRTVGLRTPNTPLSCNDFGQVVHTYIALSQSGTIWYCQKTILSGWDGNRWIDVK